MTTAHNTPQAPEPGHRAGTRPTTTLTARNPEDVLALVPVVLGFEPRHSLVMLTFGGVHQFHARIDLPSASVPLDGRVTAGLSGSLIRPALEHEVERVVLVLYTGDGLRARRIGRALISDFESVGIAVIDVLQAHEGRWYSPARRRPGVGAEGVPYSVDAHPFRAQAVLEGRVTLGSREELAATVEPDLDRVAAIQDALADAEPLNHAGLDRLLTRGLRCGTIEDPDDLASLLLSLERPKSRDRAWSVMTRDDAPDHVALWTQVVRAAPPDLVAHPAAVLGFAAWLAGSGALAWCALDRCLDRDPDNTLGGLVATMLSEAVPPTLWSQAFGGPS